MKDNTARVFLPSLADLFSDIRDPRKPKGVRYQYRMLLVLLSLAKFCGQDTPSEIADWTANRGPLLKQALALDWKRMPSQSTWQRLIGDNPAAAELDAKVGDYFQVLTEAGSELLNLDGKVLRGTIEPASGSQLHLLALAESETGSVIGQTEVAAGENEISAAKRLLGETDLQKKIVSGDAIFAQRELAERVVTGGGDYIWKLRANQGALYERAAAHFAGGGDRYMSVARSVEKGHGRLDERLIETSFRVAGELEFPYLEQVFRIRRRSLEIKTGRQTEQTIYGLTSLNVAQYAAPQLLELTRRHWRIENGLHYRRDVTFKEDKCRQTSKRGGRLLAVFNNLTIGILRRCGWENIAKARRYYSARIDEALSLITTALTSLL